MGSEFYRDERPQGPGSGDGDGSGIGGVWGGGGGGGGGGGNGQAYWGEGDTDKPTLLPEHGIWSELDAPVLRVCPDGFLLTDGALPRLLTGIAMCQWPPSILCWIGGDKKSLHTDCMLITADKSNAFSWEINIDVSEKQRESGLCACGYLDWLRPGIITFSAKWQAGHYDHGEISRVRFAVFGVDLGYRVLALKKYITVFTIKITENYEIYVNNLRGSLNGNGRFLE